MHACEFKILDHCFGGQSDIFCDHACIELSKLNNIMSRTRKNHRQAKTSVSEVSRVFKVPLLGNMSVLRAAPRRSSSFERWRYTEDCLWEGGDLCTAPRSLSCVGDSWGVRLYVRGFCLQSENTIVTCHVHFFASSVVRHERRHHSAEKKACF